MICRRESIFLQLRLGKEPVEHDLGVGVLFYLDDDAHAVAVGLVAQAGDALEALVAHLVGDVLDELALVDLVGQLGDDDAEAVVAVFLYLGARPDDDLAAAGGVGGADAAAAHDDALGGEIGAFDILHKVGQARVRVIEDADAGVDDLGKVVRRDIRGHADGYAARAVDQEVWEARGEHAGLLSALVEVGVPVHGLLVDVPEHLVGYFRHAGLGVTVGRRGIAVHGAEVAVAVNERIAHGKVLRETDQRVVNGAVAVRMVVTEHVADGGGALLEGLVGGEPALVHSIEDTPMHGLEPVPHVRQRPAHDDAHGVAHVALFHLAHDLARDDLLIGEHYVLGFVVLCHCCTTLGVVFVLIPSVWIVIDIIPYPAIVQVIAYHMVVIPSLPYFNSAFAVRRTFQI